MAAPHRFGPQTVHRLGIALISMFCVAATPSDVARGLELFDALEYDRAVVVLGRALTAPNLPRTQRLAALETLAFSYAILGDGVNAESTFSRLLDESPDHELSPDSSPRLREAFAAARKAWSLGRDVRFELTSAEERVEGSLSGDPARVGQVVAVDELGERTPLACTGPRCEGPRPGAEYRVEVRDHQGGVLSVAGPYSGREQSGDTLLIVGAIAAGALAGGLILGLVFGGSELPDGSLGQLQLP